MQWLATNLGMHTDIEASLSVVIIKVIKETIVIYGLFNGLWLGVG